MNSQFDDNCYELTMLRWFRDKFVSMDDINHYFEIAPIIVDSIEKSEDADIMYEYIYEFVVNYCVKQIEIGNYDEAYLRYKSSILALEQEFTKKQLMNILIKILK